MLKEGGGTGVTMVGILGRMEVQTKKRVKEDDGKRDAGSSGCATLSDSSMGHSGGSHDS